ncbi:CU044_5270 family protein [Nocardioides sp. LHG3406-4]|uniref:CU044_5270 family protein n=1 Tax=Nocardioides sp. LHG3406-4 TaxID=2804575 RepID=UPI003CEFC472
MDELTLVRELRADAPAAAPSGARDVLLAELRPPRRSRARWLVSAAAVLALGAGGLVALQTGPGASPSAAAVLQRAAAVVADDVVERPRDDQWVFETMYGGATVGEPFEMIPGEAWTRFDGTQFAGGPSDRPGKLLVQDLVDDPEIPTPEEWYDGAAALPAEPAALLAALRDGDLADAKGPTEAARDFDAVVETLGQPLLPAQARANLFRALATIHGVGIDEDARPDLLDRPVLSVTFDGVPDVTGIESRREMLLDPHTYAYVGTRVTALEAGHIGAAGDPGFDLTPGETWYESTVLPAAVVDRPGQRP